MQLQSAKYCIFTQTKNLMSLQKKVEEEKWANVGNGQPGREEIGVGGDA